MVLTGLKYAVYILIFLRMITKDDKAKNVLGEFAIIYFMIYMMH